MSKRPDIKDPLVPAHPFNESGEEVLLDEGSLGERVGQELRGRVLLKCGRSSTPSGGSPPMFDASTSAIRNGIGLSPNRSRTGEGHRREISSTVVRLSSAADAT